MPDIYHQVSEELARVGVDLRARLVDYHAAQGDADAQAEAPADKGGA